MKTLVCLPNEPFPETLMPGWESISSRNSLGRCRRISSSLITVTEDKLSPTVFGPRVAVTTIGSRFSAGSEDWAATARGRANMETPAIAAGNFRVYIALLRQPRAPARVDTQGSGLRLRNRQRAGGCGVMKLAGIRPPKQPTATPGVFPGRSPGLQAERTPGAITFPCRSTVAHQIAVNLLTVAGAASDLP